MPLKGLNRFRQKIPAFSGKKIAILPVFMLFMAVVAFLTCIYFDSLPALSNSSAALAAVYPLFGVILVMSIGFVFVWQMWFWRNRLKAKYGVTSYQRIFLVGFGGIAWILTTAINQYIPYYLFAPTYWANSPLRLLATPLENLLGNVAPIMLVIRYIITIGLLLTGIMMIIRAVQVFGIDYMVVLYLYFPEESKIQKNEIYSALRHPTYAGAIIIGLGGAFFVFTGLSFISFIVFLVGFYIHIRLIEERELIKRFGSSYIQYRKRVPAFFVSPTNLRAFVRFLTKSDKKHPP